jgi:hypothetical protein
MAAVFVDRPAADERAARAVDAARVVLIAARAACGRRGPVGCPAHRAACADGFIEGRVGLFEQRDFFGVQHPAVPGLEVGGRELADVRAHQLGDAKA